MENSNEQARAPVCAPRRRRSRAHSRPAVRRRRSAASRRRSPPSRSAPDSPSSAPRRPRARTTTRSRAVPNCDTATGKVDMTWTRRRTPRSVNGDHHRGPRTRPSCPSTRRLGDRSTRSSSPRRASAPGTYTLDAHGRVVEQSAQRRTRAPSPSRPRRATARRPEDRRTATRASGKHYSKIETSVERVLHRPVTSTTTMTSSRRSASGRTASSSRSPRRATRRC